MGTREKVSRPHVETGRREIFDYPGSTKLQVDVTNHESISLVFVYPQPYQLWSDLINLRSSYP
jgi:hypothetical protein